MSDVERRELRYTVNVESCWKAWIVSPFVGGGIIVGYGETIEEAHRAMNLEVVKQAHERGMSVEPLESPEK
jgi:hypothetical protein